MQKNKKDEYEFDRLFRKWKRDVERSNLLQELRKREFFEKPSAKRHRKNQSVKKQNEIRLLEERKPRRRPRYKVTSSQFD